MIYITLIFSFSIFLLFSKKYSKLSTDKNARLAHQMYTADKYVPLLGGYFILIPVFSNHTILFQNLLFLFIFLTGVLSDIRLLNSPKLRFLIQFCLAMVFIIFSKTYINNTSIDILDNLLGYKFFNILFVTFCILILMNGTNFIDGLNGLVSGYYIITLLVIIYLGNNNIDTINYNFYKILIFTLSIIFILNLLNKIYLGDGGSYLLSFVIGISTIKLYSQNSQLSSLFIVLLFWYPCFENLFSIIRKLYQKKSPLHPDNKHFHQLTFNFIKNKFKIKNNLLSNNITSILIIFYNMGVLFVGSLYAQSTNFQVFIIAFNVLLYIFLYQKLDKHNY
tara:strand:- start:312 stop:1316 length:1005 start_codon:yes stop_codon:yes gene_type:complete